MALSAACVAATAINPYGFAPYWKAVLGSSQSATFGKIREWLPPLSFAELRVFFGGGALPPLLLHVVAFCVLAICALWAWRANPQRRWAEALWIAMFAVLFLQQRRHMWLAAIVCLAVIGSNSAFLDWRAWGSRGLQTWNKRTGRAPQTPFPTLHRVLVTSAAYLLAIALVTRWMPSKAPQIVARTPDAACAALQNHFSNQREVRVFSEYESSSYLQWRLNSNNREHRVLDVSQNRDNASRDNANRDNASRDSEDRVLDVAQSRARFPLFIDLLNAYPDSVTQQYLAIIGGDETLLRPNSLRSNRLRFKQSSSKSLSSRGAQAVILSAQQRQNALAKKLNASLYWRRIYNGRDGDVWVLR